MPNTILEMLIEGALPSDALFGKENFAGDQDVEQFVLLLKNFHNLDLLIFVSWRCPPDFSLIQSAYGQAIIRSERLDTLLIQYVHLKSNYFKIKQLGEELSRTLIASTIIRWITEFFIGYKMPRHSLNTLRYFDQAKIRLDLSPFRDQILVSVPLTERISIQCFSIAHEFGHIVHGRNESSTFQTAFLGIPLIDYINRDLSELSLPPVVESELQKLCELKIDPIILASEIEADIFSLCWVIEYLYKFCKVSLEDAVKAALLAFEAHSFMNAARLDCKLLLNTSKEQFSTETFINGTKISVRAQCVIRQAGITWAALTHGTYNLKKEDISTFVPLVDSFYIPAQEFLLACNDFIVDLMELILKDFVSLSPEDKAMAWADDMEILKNDHELNLELWKILIAFGCSGSVRPVEFLESLASKTHN